MIRMLRTAAASALTISLIFLPLGTVSAQTDNSLNPQTCNSLYNLPQGTITTAASSQYLNAQTCAAYEYLISIFQPGSSTLACIPNAKVVGITSLNPDFAVRLAAMLKAGSAAVGQFRINSAYRNACAQLKANPNGFGGNPSGSMHTKGLAADLIYPGGGTNQDCSSAGYQWIIANAKNYGIAQYSQVHSYVSGECNHVESTTAVVGSLGPGSALAGLNVPQTPSGALSQALSNLLGQSQPQQQTTSGITPGTILSQDYYCMTSINPVVTVPVPAGTPFPSNCYNGYAQTSQQLPPPPPPQLPQQQQQPQPVAAAPAPAVTTGTTPTTIASSQTTSQTPPPIGTINSTPLTAGTCSPQTYCMQGNIYYRSTQCVDQIYQTCSNGCSGVVCTASASSSQTTSLSANTNTQTTGTTSAFDLINNLFANTPTFTPVEIGTATPIDVSIPLTAQVEDTGNATELTPQTGGATSSFAVPTEPENVVITISGGDQAQSATSTQDTFAASNDQSSATTSANDGGASILQNAVNSTLAALEQALPFLQPFGGAVQTGTSASE